jgi:cytochrome P450
MEAKRALPHGKYDFPWKNVSSSTLAHELPLLRQTFMETNRKHPAAAMGTSRSVGKQPLIVGNGKIQLPAHSTVLLPPWTLHRNERLYPNPEVFDPSRFDDATVSSRDPYAFQPFSGGPRNCLGSRLARAEALSLFAPLLRRYEVHCDSKKEPDDHFSLTRRPKKAVMFTFTPRPE